MIWTMEIASENRPDGQTDPQDEATDYLSAPADYQHKSQQIFSTGMQSLVAASLKNRGPVSLVCG
jgi:hypothetical protein